MKITILDGYTLNPGDLSWDRLSSLGDLKIYDRTPTEQIIERASGSEILITNKTPIDSNTINTLKNLKYIGVLATGYNVVDIEAAKKRQIPVTNIPTYGTNSVAQFAFALILELCHNVASHSNSVFKGEWSASPDFSFWKHPLTELESKTIGVIGFGRIGRRTAIIAQAFGMKVIGFDKNMSDPLEYGDFRWADSLTDLLQESDFVSLHCPLLPETKEIINASTLSAMKNTAFLINTSRGPLVNEHDLADALNNDMIAGAGLDVLSVEPPSGSNPLLSAKNCLITPHIAWATKEARTRLLNTAAENLESYLSGNPVNVVNK